MDWMVMAVQAAAEVPQDGDSWWKNIGLVLLGLVMGQVISWIKGWTEGKGKEWVNEKIEGLQATINSNSIMSQIAADDAVMGIIKEAIPEVITELGETAQKDWKDGKFDKVEWEEIGERLWARTKPIIIAGKNDYLKESSFDDGKAIAKIVAQKFLKKKKAKEEGLVDE